MESTGPEVTFEAQICVLGGRWNTLCQSVHYDSISSGNSISMKFPVHNVTELDALAFSALLTVSVSFTRGQPVSVHIQCTCTCSQCSLHDERNAVHFHDKNTLLSWDCI